MLVTWALQIWAMQRQDNYKNTNDTSSIYLFMTFFVFRFAFFFISLELGYNIFKAKGVRRKHENGNFSRFLNDLLETFKICSPCFSWSKFSSSPTFTLRLVYVENVANFVIRTWNLLRAIITKNLLLKLWYHWKELAKWQWTKENSSVVSLCIPEILKFWEKSIEKVTSNL